MNQWRSKYKTKTGATTGVDRDGAMLASEKGERTDGERGGRNGHAVRSFRGQEGLWGEGRGQKGGEIRYGRWRLAGVDVCLGGQAIQDRKRRGRIGCKRAVCLSQILADGGGRTDTEGEGK